MNSGASIFAFGLCSLAVLVSGAPITMAFTDVPSVDHVSSPDAAVSSSLPTDTDFAIFDQLRAECDTERPRRDGSKRSGKMPWL